MIFLRKIWMPKMHQKEDIMEEAIVSKRNEKRRVWAFLAVFLAAALFLFLNVHTAYAAEGLKLSTDYPGISVKPGDNLNIPVTLDNYTGSSLDAEVKVSAMPDGWEGYLQGGNYQVSRIHVKNGEAGAEMTLHVTVPKELTEGTYEFPTQTHPTDIKLEEGAFLKYIMVTIQLLPDND